MKPLRVNADYEVELFHNRAAPEVINQTIEFFLFFLSDRVLYSKKKYAQSYLDRIEALTGHRPQVTSQGPFENFWGPLLNIEAERWWNSKLTSTELIIHEKWCEKTRIIRADSNLSELDLSETYLLKDPFAMSGQKFQLLRSSDSEDMKLALIQKAVAHGPQILEPFFERKYDFSQYVFPDGKKIAYQNLVDSKFQYKGSIYNNHKSSNLKDLSFYGEISLESWEIFQAQTQTIIGHYQQHPNQVGFSIDSFVYVEKGELKIRVMSEVNYRRTMGRVAYELSQRFSPQDPWTALILIKPQTFREHKNIMVLSPGDSRFDILFLHAENSQAGAELLAHTELAVKL
jgi:hypothetical protein